MTEQMLPMWEVVLDGVQVLLCVTIFLFLLHNRIKYKRWLLNAVPQDKTVVFSDEIRMQQFKQLAEKSFDHVVDAINQERLALQAHFESGFTDSEQQVSALQTPNDFKNVIQDDESGSGSTELGNFSQIVALAEKGLSVREISQRLNMPGGEVELVLRLNKDEDSGNISIPAKPGGKQPVI